VSRERLVHVRLPEDVTAVLDRVVRARKMSRNRFIVEAVTEKLAREARAEAVRETRGVLGPEDAPEWAETPAAAWVRRIRKEEPGHPPWST